jgi:hypothetical protein
MRKRTHFLNDFLNDGESPSLPPSYRPRRWRLRYRLAGKVLRSMRHYLVSFLVSLSGPRMGSSRNHREAPAHHQNSSFNPYCMMRGFTLKALIFPKVLGLETLLAGFAKFG